MADIEFTGAYEANMRSVFLDAYKRAFTESVEFLFAECYKAAPIGKTSKGPVNLRNALKWDFDWTVGEAFIGIPSGSEMEKIAFYVEMGTGERGATGWKQWFDEKRPTFTIPIVPLKAKALHFVDDSGKDVFLKKSKGQKPTSFMRRTFYYNQKKVERIWKREFSTTKIKNELKMKKI